MGVYQKQNEKLANWSKLEHIWSIGWCLMVILRFLNF